MTFLAKPNYQFEKRQKELAKKNKKEEKRRQKSSAADDTGSSDMVNATDAQPSSNAESSETEDRQTMNAVHQ